MDFHQWHNVVNWKNLFLSYLRAINKGKPLDKKWMKMCLQKHFTGRCIHWPRPEKFSRTSCRWL